jgi:hypothetical protein
MASEATHSNCSVVMAREDARLEGVQEVFLSDLAIGPQLLGDARVVDEHLAAGKGAAGWQVKCPKPHQLLKHLTNTLDARVQYAG